MTDTSPYRSRRSAGQFLAQHLGALKGREGNLVLALPRGGVPVGFEVAQALAAPLDVFVVQPIVTSATDSAPLGAVTSGGVFLWSEANLAGSTLTREQVEAAATTARERASARERALRGDRPPLVVQGRHVIVVDDGFLTGGTMRFALAGLAPLEPASVTVAAPVGSAATCADLRARVDAVICPRTPDPFYAVGLWYEQFAPVADEEAHQLIDGIADLQERRRPVLRSPDDPYTDITRV